jgi:RNA polymerase sigma-70 factor, ECF subfamily
VTGVGWLRNRAEANDEPPEDPGGSDSELVARAKRGDAQAFGLLYRRYLDQVYDFAAHRLDSREAAEDATQAIFLRAVTSLDHCRNEQLFAGWLFAIARNVITDSYRSRRYTTQPLDTAPDVADPALALDLLVIHADSERELREARIHCLSASERELLDLRLQGLSDKEIAIALGRGHGAIRTAQYRLVLKLRECLGDNVRAKEVDHVVR